MHINLFNITEDIYEKQTLSGAWSVACPRIGYAADNRGTRKTMKKSLQLTNLYCCTSNSVKHFDGCAEEGLLGETRDSKYLLLHLVIASYLNNTPESEDPLSLESQNPKAIACQMSEAKKRDTSRIF